MILVALPFIFEKSSIESKLYVVLLIVFVVIVNATKIPEADLENYYQWYDDLSKVSFIDAYKVNSSDPVFIYITSLLTVFDSERSFLIFWNFLNILLVVIVSARLNKLIGFNDNVLICTQLILGIFYFSQPEHMTHTTRAFVSLSFMLLAISYLLKCYKGLFVISSVASVGIHSSSLILLGSVFRYKRVLTLLVFSFAVGHFDIFNILKSLLSVFNWHAINNALDYLIYRSSDLSQFIITSKQLAIVFLELIIVLFVYYTNARYLKNDTVERLCQLFVFVCSLIFIFRNIPLFSVRVYMYHNYFFYLNVGSLFLIYHKIFSPRIGHKLVFSLLSICCIFVIYVNKFVLGSNWTYEFYSQDRIFQSLFGILGN
ncbi:EpsG family protein [Photobacterium swingsii]|uniref:EpsG family protein n=1 Tax=Photobacterium swingsii TaxID=680026 RepID=UPI003D133EB5